MDSNIILIDNGVYYQKENIYIFNNLTYLKANFNDKVYKCLFEFDSLEDAINTTNSMSKFCFPSLNDFKNNYEESMEKFNKVDYWRQICNFLDNYERCNDGVKLTDLIEHLAEGYRQRLENKKEESKPKRKNLFKRLKERLI